MSSDPGTSLIVSPQAVCERAFDLLRAHQLDDAEKLLANALTKVTDPVSVGLLHSALGVVERVRGNSKLALRHYERAERLMADDPALKLITARLLIDQFREYDGAIRRCQKAIKLLPGNPVVVHHAHTLIGVAYAGQGKRVAAVASLEQSIVNDFRHFVTADNIDFHLIEACARKKWGVPQCERFLLAAKTLAESAGEGRWVATIEKILTALAVETPAN